MQDWHGDTPLHQACQGGRVELHCTAFVGVGNLDVVKFLVEEYKCDPKV